MSYDSSLILKIHEQQQSVLKGDGILDALIAKLGILPHDKVPSSLSTKDLAKDACPSAFVNLIHASDLQFDYPDEELTVDDIMYAPDMYAVAVTIQASTYTYMGQTFRNPPVSIRVGRLDDLNDIYVPDPDMVTDEEFEKITGLAEDLRTIAKTQRRFDPHYVALKK